MARPSEARLHFMGHIIAYVTLLSGKLVRKGSIKTKRMLAATSDQLRADLLGAMT